MVGNPPPIAPAVPLLERPRKGGSQDVFLAGFAKSSTASSTSTTDVTMTAEEATSKCAGCSGDPANCTACGFGKAFCDRERYSTKSGDTRAVVGQSVAGRPPKGGQVQVV